MVPRTSYEGRPGIGRSLTNSEPSVIVRFVVTKGKRAHENGLEVVDEANVGFGK